MPSRSAALPRALVLALVLAAAAWALSRLAFGTSYHVAIILPAEGLACLAVAWFSYLRTDGFLAPRASGPADDGFVRPTRPDPSQKPTGRGSSSLAITALWAGLILLALAAALYALFGVGATFY